LSTIYINREIANWSDRSVYTDKRQVEKVRQSGEQPETIKVPVVVTNDVLETKVVTVIVFVLVVVPGLRADKSRLTAPRRASGIMPYGEIPYGLTM